MQDLSSVTWGKAPLFGAFGAGRQDPVPVTPPEFGLTPSAAREQEAPRAEPEPSS